MNIEFQCCGLIICVLLALFYISKDRLNLYSEYVFFCSLFMTILLLVLDISSVVAITYQERLPALLVEAVCKLYVVTLVCEAGMALLYILVDVIGEKRHKRVALRLAVITWMEAIVIALLPISIYSEGRTVYTYGLCTSAVYGFAAIYMVAILAVAFLNRHVIYPRRWFAFMVWMAIWIFAMGVQFLNSELLVVGFAAAVGMIILFVLLENPEANFDRQLGCFNTYALERYLSQIYEREEPFQVVSVIMKEADVDKNEIFRSYLHMIKNPAPFMVFKGLNMDFMMITRDKQDAQKLVDKILDMKKKREDILDDASLVYVENGLQTRGASDLTKMIRYLENKYKTLNENQYIDVTDEMIADYRNLDVIKARIRKALDEDRVEVFFQPIYSTQKDRFTAAEVLTRIRNEDGSLLSPKEFIPVAEDTGMMCELGDRIFEKTCQFLKDSRAGELGLECIHINLSVVQCEQENLAQHMLDTMKKYGVDSYRINLEITETAVLNAKKRFMENMDKLMENGIRFSLDDFGKGNSNLMYIVEMPVSSVKLDQDMSKAYFTIPKAKCVVRSVTEMAHDMEMEIVAEGIEKKEEMVSMKDQGIDYIQGFYFSRPLPCDAFLEFMEKHACAAS